jgi:hypothetical protein
MSGPASPVRTGHVPLAGRRLPPEERFWQRYSSRHELPLSGTAALVLHVLGLAVLLVGGLLLARTGWIGGKPAPSVSAIVIDPGDRGPSGQVPQVARNPVEAVAPDKEPTSPIPPSRAPEPLHEPPRPMIPVLTVPAPDSPGRPLDWVDPPSDPLVKLPPKLLKILEDPAAPPSSKVDGPGGGDGGPAAKMKQRQQRQARWTMVFNTHDGEDYLRQLRALGAILAIPKSEGEHLVIRDLTREPAQPKAEDLTKLDRIYWIDDKPESVASLARALGIARPAYIVAFFPENLEKELLQKERAFAGRKEDAIQETRFDIVKTDKGYEPKATAQVPVR